MQFLLIDRMIKEERLYVYNMRNIVEKHFSISNAPVRSRGESLVHNNKDRIIQLVVKIILY
jgi:hypothetical protein